MSDEYQLRKDIDTLYDLVYDNESHQLRLVTKEEFNRLIEGLPRNQGAVKLGTLFYDKSEVDTDLTVLNEDLTILSSSLDLLESSLIEFNGELIDFDDDNKNLKEDLTKLKNNLHYFTVALNKLTSDLTSFESELDTFDFQLNGDATHDGFADTLGKIQSSMGTLETKLDEFGDALADLDTGDTKLSLTLSQLTGYLTSFKGTLTEFRQKIIDDLGQSVYDGLDEQIIKLIGSITSANQDIEDHQDLIDDVQGTIGNPTDSAESGQDTLYGVLNDTSDVADTASQQASIITNTVNNTITPRINTIKNTDIPQLQGNIDDVQDNVDSTNTRIDGTISSINTLTNTTIPKVRSEISDVQDNVDIVQAGVITAQTDINNNNHNLQQMFSPHPNVTEVWIVPTPPDMQDFRILSKYYDTSNIQYAYDYYNTSTYEISGQSWISSDFDIDANCVGVMYDIDSALTDNVFKSVQWIYTAYQNKYYKYAIDESGVLGRYGKFIESSEMPNFITNTTIYESISKEIGETSNYLKKSTTSGKTNYTIDELLADKSDTGHTHTASEISDLSNWRNYWSSNTTVLDYNPYLKLVHFYGNFSQAVTTSEVTIDYIPPYYLPKGDKIQLCHNNLNHPTMIRVRASDGYVLVHGTNSGTRDISFDFIWRY